MASRPKQRVLVRWNDDLDKALLLFITHICSESGIKIPYDEVARRMGSTFTEGAITQHLSKLRTKMAELNVVPVPAASKRGAITNKPSSVYAQKSRGGPPLQQPIASKTQAKNAAARNTTTNERPKRSTRRRAEFIKRSESDDGQTDDEFGGGSDDDFVVEGNTPGKRKAATNDRQDQARKKVNTLLSVSKADTASTVRAVINANIQKQTNTGKDHQTRTDQNNTFIQESVENIMEGRGITSHYGQLSHAAGYEEEEEDGRPMTVPSQVTLPTAHVSSPFQSGQYNHISPTSTPHMTARNDNPLNHNPAQPFSTHFPVGAFQMMPAFAAHPNVPISQYPSLANSSIWANEANRIDMDNFAATRDKTLAARGSGLSNNYFAMSEANDTDMSNFANTHPPSPHPPTRMGRANYPGAQPFARKDSMVSGSSQMTHSGPATPSANHSGGFDGAQSSPYSYNNWSPNAATDQSVFEQPFAQNQVMNNDWGFDGQFDANNTYANDVVNEDSIGGAFVSDLFG